MPLAIYLNKQAAPYPLSLSAWAGPMSRPSAHCAPINRYLALSRLIPRYPGYAPITHSAPWNTCNMKHLDATYVKHWWNIWNILLQHMSETHAISR
jgi:hypothetical protein